MKKSTPKLPPLNLWPSLKKLMEALEAEEPPLPDWIIKEARAGEFHDYLNQKYAMPQVQLLGYLRHLGDHDALCERIMEGEFDATKEESDRWARSEDGQATFAELLKGKE